jgi:hypothetical protein
VNAVLPYTCGCGRFYLVAIRSQEQNETELLLSGLWDRTVATVAGRLGVAHVDARDEPLFVCESCQTVHVHGRQQSAPAETAPVGIG